MTGTLPRKREIILRLHAKSVGTGITWLINAHSPIARALTIALHRRGSAQLQQMDNKTKDLVGLGVTSVAELN